MSLITVVVTWNLPASFGQNGGQRRVIDGGKEPTHHIAIFFADRHFGIIHDAVDILKLGRHNGKHVGADHHDHAADDPCENAKRQVPARYAENFFGFKENAATDDDTHDHRNSGKQAVLLFELCIHCPIPLFNFSCDIGKLTQPRYIYTVCRMQCQQTSKHISYKNSNTAPLNRH